MDGFFPAIESSRPETDALVPKCGACGIFETCKSPKMPVSGKGKKGILLVAEAPGGDEDEYNEQFVGVAGKLLRQRLEIIGIDIDRDCWKTNAIICRPTEKKSFKIRGTDRTEQKIINRTPTKKEVEYCRPNLLNTIKELNPRVIVLMGAQSVCSLIEPLYRGDTGGISHWAGWVIPLQKWNAWVIPTVHPSYVRRGLDDEEGNGKVIQVIFDRHLKAACALEGRPWQQVPDYKSQIQLIYEPEELSAKIDKYISTGGAIAFDYETNRLKPDVDGAKIVCCSICWRGQETIAYPWTKDTADITSKILRKPLPKIGANIKFEERWTRSVLGHGVNNWVWDTMLSAHHLDNRPRVTSVKFQALVRLGQEDWSASVRPFLEDSDKDGFNRIDQANQRSLLFYCGLDSKLEYEIAKLQRKEMQSVG